MPYYDPFTGGWWADKTLDGAAGEAEEVRIDSINTSSRRFAGCSIRLMARHYKRIRDADVSIPIIVSSNGRIFDGTHRLIKALAEGRKTILARRIEKMPRPDGRKRIGQWGKA